MEHLMPRRAAGVLACPEQQSVYLQRRRFMRSRGRNTWRVAKKVTVGAGISSTSSSMRKNAPMRSARWRACYRRVLR